MNAKTERSGKESFYQVKDEKMDSNIEINTYYSRLMFHADDEM